MRLTEYVKHRLEQLEEEKLLVEDFKAKHNLNVYSCIDRLTSVLREFESQNASADKERNVRYLIPPMFYLDLSAILNGEEVLPLPDSLLDIGSYLDDLERQRREIEAKRQAEMQAAEAKRLQEKWRLEDAERRAKKREQLCEALGLSPQALAKLQAEE